MIILFDRLPTGRWRSWLSHLSNTQKVLSSNLGRLIFSNSRGTYAQYLCSRVQTSNPLRLRKNHHQEIIVHIILQLNNLGSMPKENWYNLRLSKKKERGTERRKKESEWICAMLHVQPRIQRKHPQKFHE